MKSYNQFCPIAKAAEIFCERWTALILRDLSGGGARFSDLQRGVPLASPTLLSQRLKALQQEGIVARRRAPGAKVWTYHLTPAGEEFVPLVIGLGVWGQRWSRRELAEHEIDLGLLLWALEKGVRPDAFGERRTVIEIEFTDQPAKKRRWWFLNEKGKCELCLRAPDRESDLYVIATLPDVIRVWRGDVSVAHALSDGHIDLVGPQTLRKAFRHWFGVAALAHVKSVRPGEAPKASARLAAVH